MHNNLKKQQIHKHQHNNKHILTKNHKYQQNPNHNINNHHNTHKIDHPFPLLQYIPNKNLKQTTSIIKHKITKITSNHHLNHHNHHHQYKNNINLNHPNQKNIQHNKNPLQTTTNPQLHINQIKNHQSIHKPILPNNKITTIKQINNLQYPITILIIHHKQNKNNITQQLSSTTPNNPLTEHNQRQTAQITKKLTNHNITQIYYSPLLQTQQTTNIITNLLNINTPIILNNIQKFKLNNYKNNNTNKN